MSCTNMHKANLRSQFNIFNTGLFAWEHPRLNELTWMPSNDPLKRFYMGTRTTKMKPQGRTGQTSCTNVYKANLG